MSAEAARHLLGRMLDRIEAIPLERRRQAVWEQVPGSVASGEAREAMHDVFAGAERAGAVKLRRGKGETAHLVTGVCLASAELLYRHLRRTPAVAAADAVSSTLREELGAMLGDKALETLDELAQGWRQLRRPYGVLPDLGEGRRFLLSLDAVLRRPASDKGDLRTLSSKAGLDSKMVETQVGRIVAWMVAAGRLPPGLSDDEARLTLGLERFAHPVLVAGTARLRGLPLGAFSYVGVAPADVEELEPGADAEVILTVENFASFNRQVTEAMTGREIVVYTAGFPSRATVRALRRLRGPGGVPLLHWGDIDAGGIRIADCLAREVAPDLSLHLMTSELASTRGVSAAPDASISGAGENAEIAALARFLAEQGAVHLEQERIDPVAATVRSAGRPSASGR